MAFFQYVNGILWGPVMMVLLLGTGVLFTWKLRFIQFRRLKDAFKETFGKMFDKSVGADASGISSFQALSTAVAAQVGTGNLVGVSTAIAAGGPGAVFWMWISGVFGMGTVFAEAVLGQEFKESVDGEMTGGPAFYIRNGLGSKTLAGLFAVSIVMALGIVGNMVQSNSIATAMSEAFGISTLVIGIVIAILVGLVIIGGLKRIANITERVVPFMAVMYFLASLVVILINYQSIIPSVKMIFYGAFNPAAATGGVIGVSIKQAFRYGIARGLFSNEAGMGSTPHAHAVAKVDHPAQQGLVAIFGVFFDTFIVCTMTALVIITSGVFKSEAMRGAAMTQAGFAQALGGMGEKFVAIGLFFFAFTTIISWYYFGEANIKYLFGKGKVKFYRWAVVLCVILGAVMKVPVIWEMADMFNGIMVIPNVVALLGMVSLVSKIYDDYEYDFLEGNDSEYENQDLKKKNAN
ncbi:Na(+)-linked D-alanine glycine permease [Halanaerobium saccharolyticum subsp. saccharolyticum DSM 6643]|uniref:Na(+)-linked D-alanine glycine permease n=1 Tax=Halanaerobium saccharolyticum subsp. saccharolyticum DSM 6643 TaxID=1293054 RepID=M5DX09_9FIRM|nr:sodium:alanine symporter family protein [Halanaerobium saccharolyticum]CCU77533.1 Na(+)-linked D-alanine glycine permease [Halanaerobium saccharolyticum subsp. saccharolyticum DSM 6643]